MGEEALTVTAAIGVGPKGAAADDESNDGVERAERVAAVAAAAVATATAIGIGIGTAIAIALGEAVDVHASAMGYFVLVSSVSGSN